MATTSTQMNIEHLTPFLSAVALNNIPVSSVAPTTDGMALIYNATTKQWQAKQVLPPTPAATAIGGTDTWLGNNAGLASVGNAAAQNDTGIGYQALQAMTTGIQNTAIGQGSEAALTSGTQNTSLGVGSLAGLLTGSTNVAIGYNAGSAYTGAENRNILIGNTLGTTGESNAIRIGNTVAPTSTTCFIQGISGVTVAGATNAVINASGQLGTIISSKRYKQNIVDAKDYADALAKLHVKNFQYKNLPDEFQVGLIAEDVQEILPELVVLNKEGLVETVKYHDFIPILIQKTQALQCQNDDLKKQLQDAKKDLCDLKDAVAKLQPAQPQQQ